MVCVVNASVILAIDPGTHESGYCLLNVSVVIDSGVMANRDLRTYVSESLAGVLAIEKIVSYGSSVGQETFDTCEWIGRFREQWDQPEEVLLIPRRTIKKHLCGKGVWGDADVRKALLTLVGPQGTKKEPGPTYGVKSHAWAALAVAVTARDTML